MSFEIPFLRRNEPMIFPNLNFLTSAASRSASDSIDRSLQNRQHRLVAGISVDEQFNQVHGCLAVIKGQGKFAKLKFASGTQSEIPKSIQRSCLAAVANPEIESSELLLLLRDLAEVQAAVIEDLKLKAGKYVDRVLAVAVTDPGIWSTDFDGRRSCQSMCDASTIAEIAGVNVIDALPDRDLSVGGSGRSLAALPIWILFADRNQRVANVDCVFVDASIESAEVYTLPASDGLDAELPKIGRRTETSHESVEQLIGQIRQSKPDCRLIVCQRCCQAKPRLRDSKNSSIEDFADIVGEEINLDALVAAILGMFHIDQMPANVPAITGASAQRILGRLTPGRPSHWRHLIRAMAQHQPAPMKLRDAI